jgi:hypothetical protein
MSPEQPKQIPQTEKAGESVPTHQTEQAIGKIESIVDRCRNGEICDPDDIRDIISSSPLSEMNERVRSGTVLSFKEMSSTAGTVACEVLDLDSEGTSEEGGYAKLLLGRERAIKQAINGYSRSLLMFHNLGKRRAMIDPDKFAEMFQKVDTERSRNHDALINSLKVYQSALGQLNLMGASEHIDESKFFPKQFLTDRDEIRDWAVVTKLREHLEYVKSHHPDYQKDLDTER